MGGGVELLVRIRFHLLRKCQSGGGVGGGRGAGGNKQEVGY